LNPIVAIVVALRSYRRQPQCHRQNALAAGAEHSEFRSVSFSTLSAARTIRVTALTLVV